MHATIMLTPVFIVSTACCSACRYRPWMLSPTMPELRHILTTNTSATDFQKISTKTTGEQSCIHPQWDHQHNTVLRLLMNLPMPLKLPFQNEWTWLRLWLVAIRLTNQLMTTSLALWMQLKDTQLIRPENLGDQIGIWEAQTTSCFIIGLLPELSSAVKTSCVLYNEACLEKLRRHAIHAQRQQAAKKCTKVVRYRSSYPHYSPDGCTARGNKRRLLRKKQRKRQRKRTWIPPASQNPNSWGCVLCLWTKDTLVSEVPKE